MRFQQSLKITYFIKPHLTNGGVVEYFQLFDVL